MDFFQAQRFKKYNQQTKNNLLLGTVKKKKKT